MQSATASDAPGRLEAESRRGCTCSPLAGEKPAKLPLDEKIDIKVQDAEARDLLNTMALMMGAEIELDPAVTGRCRSTVEKAPLREFLDVICNAVRCRWSYDESRKLLKVGKK